MADRYKTEKVLAASGNQAATWSTPDIQADTAGGFALTLDLTTRAAAETITISVDIKDSASGKYIQYGAFTATGAVGSYIKYLYPAAALSVTVNTESINRPLPRTFRLTFTHSGGGTHVYSVGYQTLI